MFGNTLTVHDKHYLLNRDNLTQPIQIQLSQKKKFFQNFLFFRIFKINSILNISQQKMTLVADVFQQVLAPKNMVR